MHSFCAAVLTVVFFTGGAVAQAAEPTGLWLTEGGDARIRIAKCGKSLCGTIKGIKDAIDPKTGKPPVDESNPDPAKRNRRIVGIRISSMASDGRGGWVGDIYNSDDGQTYAGKVSLRDANTLKVEGCVGVFCGGELWSRVRR